MNDTNDTFVFDVRMSISIEAPTLSEAIKIFHERYPDADEKFIYKNDQRMGRSISKTTGKLIYFEPGCQCGECDCILDPMSGIAEKCDHQSDMTPDKWVRCDIPDPDDDECDYYDDECK